MKAVQAVAFLGLASLSYAQAPSPTESIGCQPHGDHWHCEGPRPTSADAVSSAVSSAADPGPSPTESVGCQPHGDHWHCEGPATSAAVTTSAAVATSASQGHDDHDHASSADPGPSPTESVGCQPHGDHWHCEGPAVTTGVASSSAAAVTTSSADHDDHSHGSATPTKPSPTESVGCEPHGDHWHCDGPRVTSSGLTSIVSSKPTPSSNGTITTTVPTAMAAGLSTTGFGVVALAGTFAVLLAI